MPDAFFKVLLIYNGDDLKAVGFIMPNEDLSGAIIKNYATTVDEVEDITGIDFFPALPDNIEESVEGDFSAWIW